MSDSQNVPVFLRDYMQSEPRFLGRFTVDELEPLVTMVRRHGCFTGDDITNSATTQFMCYEGAVNRGPWHVGFEIVLGLTDDDVSG